MRSALCLAVASLLCGQAGFAAGNSVDELIVLVRSSLKARERDSKLVKSLGKIKLTERLDSRVVEELESEGAGPKAVEELEKLQEASRGLPKPALAAVFSEPPAPLADDQDNILQLAAENALHYSANLPNFICTEVVRRFVDASASGAWNLQDVLTIKLTYFENREDYQLIQVNGRATSQTYFSLQGAVSGGEFGSLLVEAFAPDSKTQFVWDHWTHLRKRLAHVYSYQTKAENSRYQLTYTGANGERREANAGRHGFIYVDSETGMVLRIVAEADSIPPTFPIRAESSVVDYDFANVGGNEFLLPLRARVWMSAATTETRNEVAFQGYRQFSGESTIHFDGAEGEPRARN
jgi:hypothetical protein